MRNSETQKIKISTKFKSIHVEATSPPGRRPLVGRRPVAIQAHHYILISRAKLAPTGVVIVSAVNFFLVPYALCLAPFINLQSAFFNLKSNIQ